MTVLLLRYHQEIKREYGACLVHNSGAVPATVIHVFVADHLQATVLLLRREGRSAMWKARRPAAIFQI